MHLIRGACLAGLLLPAVTQAQVLNGNFEAGPSGWEWKRGELERATANSEGCWTALNGYNVSNSGDTPSIGTAPASGRVGNLSHDTPSLGSWWVCKQIQQAITVPANSMLVFDAKLGSTYSAGQIAEPVDLRVEILDGGSVIASRSLSGRSEPNSCELTNTCKPFVHYALDVSEAWGRNVTLRLRARSQASSSWTGTLSHASSAHVDNVQFTAAPVPAVPQISTPSVSGNNHSISWGATGHTESYILERSVDGGAWSQVYNGPSTGWTQMSAPSGNYRYRVKACGNGCSAYSGEVSVDVPQATPGTPTAVIVGRSFDLSWGASSGAVRYVLEQKGEDGLWVAVYDGALTQSTLYNIAPGIYGYRVKACGDVVCSTYSAEQYFTAVDVTPVIVDYLL